jgi:hypothetical protein
VTVSDITRSKRRDFRMGDGAEGKPKNGTSREVDGSPMNGQGVGGRG